MRVILRKSWVLVLLLLVSAQFAWGQSADEDDIKAIQNTEFTTMDGEKVSIDDYEGKLLLLDFWETWCSPCLKSFKYMQKARSNYPDHFAVLAINPGLADEPKDIQKFLNKNDYDFTFVRDPEKLYKTLGVRSLPYKIFLDPEGNYIETSIGSLPDDYQHIEDLLEKHTDAEIETQ